MFWFDTHKYHYGDTQGSIRVPYLVMNVLDTSRVSTVLKLILNQYFLDNDMSLCCQQDTRRWFLYHIVSHYQDKQRVLTPGHQGWNDLHSLCRIGMEY